MVTIVGFDSPVAIKAQNDDNSLTVAVTGVLQYLKIMCHLIAVIV